MTRHTHVQWLKSSHSGQEGECVEVGAWRKSTHSGEQGNCVELGAWQKSSRSTGNGGERVGVTPKEAVVLARDSKDPDGPMLDFGPDAWHTFLTTVKTGQLDLP